jgi:hypothetical protein
MIPFFYRSKATNYLSNRREPTSPKRSALARDSGFAAGF